MSGKTNILLRGQGRLHADIKKYLADDIEVKVWMDKGKYAKRTGADLTHDQEAFYSRLKIHKKTGALAVDYQYRREFLSISEKLAPHIPAFLYIYSRKPVLNGENNFREGNFCIDIGAHTGNSTFPMALAGGNSGCALVLESNPFVYHVLEKNARANTHITNIKTMMAAANADEGFLKFEYSDSGFCNGGRHANISAFKHGHPFNSRHLHSYMGYMSPSDYERQLMKQGKAA